MPNLMSHEIEQRMMEYIKLFQPQQKRAQSPDLSTSDAMNALEMSRAALWRNMYGNSNGSPPSSMNPAGSPGSTESRFNNHAFPDHGELGLNYSPIDHLTNPALSLAAPIKRERDMSGGDYTEHDFSQPPAKRASDFGRALTQSNINEILAAAAASNGIVANGARHPFHAAASGSLHEDEEHEDEEQDRDAEMDEAEDDEEARRDAMNKLRAADSLHHLSNVAMMNHAKRQMTHNESVTRSPAFRRPSPSNNNHCEGSDEEEDEDGDRSSYLPNMFGGLQFKITRAGVSDSGEPELVISMEINNVTYEGSLFAAATKKNRKLHKLAHKHSPLSTSSPVKSTTSSSGSAVTTQMVSPKNTSNGSLHNNNEADMLNNNCLSKNPHFLEPEVQIHSPPSPPQTQVMAPRIGPKAEQTSFDEAAHSPAHHDDDHAAEEEDLSMKPKKLSAHMEEMRGEMRMSS